MKDVQFIIEQVKSSEELLLKAKKAVEEKKLDGFLKEMGYEAGEEAFIAALKPQNGELDDDQLDNVAGGISKSGRIALSILTVGVGCYIETLL